MQRPLVSVVIPTHNRRRCLPEAIESVLAQEFRDFELIVVDDGSDDGTAQRLQPYASRIGLIHLRHGGVARARNAGFSLCRGDLVAFLDSDDLWHPKKLKLQVEVLRDDPGCRLCYTDEIWVRRGVRVNPAKKHEKCSGWIFERCLPLCLISPSSVLMRRELLQEMNGFDETLPVCEDYDLWLRVTARYPVTLLPERLITKRGGHADQLSRRLWGMDRFRVQSLRKILRDERLTAGQRTAAEKELVRKCRILEAGCRKHGRMGLAAEYHQITAGIEPRMDTNEREDVMD